MGKNTAIEWCDHTFNPWWGCSHASAGCDHCYAREVARRFSDRPCWDNAPRKLFGDRHWNEPRRWNKTAAKAGVRHKVFCGSMCDVLEETVGLLEVRRQLFGLIDETPQLDWLLLSKRPENASRLLPSSWFNGDWPSNVWVGTTIEHDRVAFARLQALCGLPAPVRFVSCEPLLGLTDLLMWLPGIHVADCDMDDDCVCGARHPMESVNWVIAGGESGMKARACDPEHALWLRDQCQQREVPFFFKQWGRWMPIKHAYRFDESGKRIWFDRVIDHAGARVMHGEKYYAVGKHRAGSYLGGKTYKQFPKGQDDD